jgi:hypothetical protein
VNDWLRLATGERLRLAAEIGAELATLQPHTARLQTFVLAGETQEPDALAAAAVALHHAYCALESIFERIARTFEGGLQPSDRWHTRLLHSMFLNLDGLRPAVLPIELREPLSDLMGFRHFFRHAYSALWRTDRLLELAQLYLLTLPDVNQALQSFIRQLQQPDTSE